jgi:hypothetical protein
MKTSGHIPRTQSVKHIMPVIAPGYHIDLREAYESVLKLKERQIL